MPDPTEQNPSDGGNGDSFLDSISEDMRGHDFLKDMDSVDTLAKGYIESRESLPTIPEGPDAYTFDVPEGQSMDEEEGKLFKDYAHNDLKLTNEQYQKIMKFDIERVGRQTKAYQDALAKESEEYEALKISLGTAYDTTLNKGIMIMKAAGLEEIADDAKSSPALLKLLKWVGDKVSEDNFTPGGDGGGNNQEKLGSDGQSILDFPDMD